MELKPVGCQIVCGAQARALAALKQPVALWGLANNRALVAHCLVGAREELICCSQFGVCSLQLAPTGWLAGSLAAEWLSSRSCRTLDECVRCATSARVVGELALN